MSKICNRILFVQPISLITGLIKVTRNLNMFSTKILRPTAIRHLRLMSQLGDLGSGAGKGGGGGGTIREAGGAFGKQEAAREEEYFYKQQKEQLQKLKADLKDEISFHEEQIKRHQEAISRHKNRVTELDKKE
ncbi:ATPase inhibitor mai-2, mitochondrial-like [Diorhabda sublineata]|uniref:ATPase inhibitor mai-2, mitochondrial-like n=1 Tax=Diorhabda sublineata TaxID=1163346 RepID=UPI0024E0ED8F|nr:ATPase inhibitor mai-2, mitochondrial-like [Diorhabda sublineata]